jgi:hypothetical protein
LAETSHEWILTVLDNNRSPSIDWFAPEDTEPEVDENSSLVFEHTSSDADGDGLFYSWQLDGFEMATTQNWTYWPDFDAAGSHNVTLVVSDGELFDSQEWSVLVVNVNRAPIIDSYLPPGDSVISEGDSEEFYVACYDPDDDVLAIQWYLNGTPTATIDEYVFAAGYYSAGVYNVTVAVSDGFEQVTHEWTLTVTNVERDVAITSLDPNKHVVGEGCPMSINVTVVNQGAMTETFNVTLYANGTEIGKLTDVVLGSGNSATLTFVWNTTGFVKGYYTLSAYALPVLGEVDTSDNTFTGPENEIMMTIQGDVNGDKTVNAFDILAIKSRWGTTAASPYWIPEYDVNNDNVIDVYDILEIKACWGQSW